MSAEWLAVAEEWLRRAAPSDEAWMDIRSVQFRLQVPDVGVLLEALAASRESSFAVSGRLADRVAGIHVVQKVHPCIVFGYGGPNAADEDLIAMAGQFKDIGRRLAPDVGYAFIALEPTLFSLHRARILHDPWGFARPDTVWRLSDRLVIDAFYWQVLGAGHVARIGGVPEGAAPLPGDRFELTLGDPRDWLPGRPARDQHRSEGRRLLSPCLVDQAQATRMLTF